MTARQEDERDFDEVADRLDLVPAAHSQGRDLVHLIAPANPVSVFRGAAAQDGLFVVDPLQCYLDLYHQPDAGREQAEFLLERRIRPRLAALGALLVTP